MKNAFSLQFFFLVFCSSFFFQTVFAISPSDLKVFTIPPNGNPVSGISNSIHLLPFGQSIDQPYHVEFSTEKAVLPDDIYSQHLAIFHWDEGFGFENQYRGGVMGDDAITLDVSRTGIYFLQPIVPLNDIVLHPDKTRIQAGDVVQFSSEMIMSNQGLILWDGFPFWVRINNGKIPDAIFDGEKQAFRIFSNNGNLSFEILVESPGSLELEVFTDFGEEAALGFFQTTVLDTTDVVQPPKDLKIQGNILSWQKSSDKDIVAYFLLYKLKGENVWNGVDVKEISSPVAISPNINTYVLKFAAYAEGVIYEIALRAVDVLGKESLMSNVITYDVPVLSFDPILDMIRLQTGQVTSVSVDVSFPDIADHWAREYILRLVQLGVVNGYQDGNFGPNDPVTRAQLVKIVLNAFGYEVDFSTTKSSFSDVNSTDWFSPFLEIGRNEKILSGYTDGTFHPYDAINRAEGLKILLNAAKIAIDDSIHIQYEDIDPKQWYIPYLKTATAKNIVSGSEIQRNGRILKYFYPTSSLTRAEVAKIVVKMLDQ